MTADCITYKNSINALIFLDGMINISFCSFDVIPYNVEISVRVKICFLS